MSFLKGDIIWVKAEFRDPTMLKHPAVVWEDFSDDQSDFKGIMLTHSPPSERYNNVLMESRHFEDGHEFTYSNTHFVNQLFIKFGDWGPFYKAGRLTDRGIDFLEHSLSGSRTIEYAAYVKI